MERSFDATVVTKNRQRLLAHDGGRALFDEVVWASDGEGLLSDEHFTMGGTLIEAAASPGTAGPWRDRRRTTIRTTRRWTSAGNAAATRPTPAPRIPRRACCARGKARKVALVAAMRKLLTILNAVMRDQITWRMEPLSTGI